MIDSEFVITINKEILETEKGLKGVVNVGMLESALARIDNWICYALIDDVFDIAALYAVAIAKAYAFPDGNKRTALVVITTYLSLQGIEIPAGCGLDNIMVNVASSQMDWQNLSAYLSSISR